MSAEQDFLNGIFFQKAKRQAVHELWAEYKARAHRGEANLWPLFYAEKLGPRIINGLREHLVEQQKGKCAYCADELINLAPAKPIDHILPRSPYLRFCFEYKNLCVVCYACNLLKSNSVWYAMDVGTNQYFTADDPYGFYHARYDLFDEHVSFFKYATNDILIKAYAGISDKGKMLCVKLLHQRAKYDMVLGNNSALGVSMSIISDAIQCGHIPEPDSLKNIIEEINTIIINS